MSPETHFASITDDHGPASELVHVSPIFVRCGPATRGRYADRREARTWRTDARQVSRGRDQIGDAGIAVTVEQSDEATAAAGLSRFRRF